MTHDVDTVQGTKHIEYWEYVSKLERDGRKPLRIERDGDRFTHEVEWGLRRADEPRHVTADTLQGMTAAIDGLIRRRLERDAAADAERRARSEARRAREEAIRTAMVEASEMVPIEELDDTCSHIIAKDGDGFVEAHPFHVEDRTFWSGRGGGGYAIEYGQRIDAAVGVPYRRLVKPGAKTRAVRREVAERILAEHPEATS